MLSSQFHTKIKDIKVVSSDFTVSGMLESTQIHAMLFIQLELIQAIKFIKIR